MLPLAAYRLPRTVYCEFRVLRTPRHITVTHAYQACVTLDVVHCENTNARAVKNFCG